MLRSRAAEGNALIILVLTLAWIFVGLRVCVRTFMAKCFGADDWLLLTALILFTVYLSSALAAVAHGVGTDPSTISHEDLPYAILFWWLAGLFYNPTTLFVRLSISVFIHKLCVSRTHKVIIWVTCIVSIAFSIFYFFITLFQCNPPSYFWTKYSNGKGVCMNEKVFPSATYAHSVVSAVGDWVLGLLPIWLIWDLQMNKRTKISVGVLLGLGILAGIAAMIRIPYIRILGDKKTFLYNIVDVSLWSCAEAALGILAASASALRPLFKKFYQLSTSGHRSRGKSRTYAHELHSRSATAKGGKSTGGGGGTFYKEDDSSLELGMTSRGGIGGSANVLSMNAQGGDPGSRSGSEENLTGKGIHVRTMVEVSGGRGDN